MAPTSANHRHLTIENLEDGETVYQRCVLLRGRCIKQAPKSAQDVDVVYISTTDEAGGQSFPSQTWPIAEGHFKALLFLAPGANIITLQCEGALFQEQPLKVMLNYIPLLQNPPLHLAILVAKDSPLLIDCPPLKRGGVSSAHASLEAAVSKFRMTAYMWQAFTAEDMRSKGLGRRAFRLEEDWVSDTVSQEFQYAVTEDMAWNGAMRSSAKIHIVPCEKTVAELRDAQIAQQNSNARRANDLHVYFNAALKTYGGPFISSARPVVAGLILDSHYSIQQNLILGHAALGSSDPTGISLGIFGSHLTYSWPRFIEEVTSTLLDTRDPGASVGNDNNECASMWEACSIGQGAFLHEVGHAFGSGHTSGIMVRGYAQHWPRNFLSRTSYCTATKEEAFITSDPGVANDATWDIKDALSYRNMQHFKLPSDSRLHAHEISTLPHVEVLDEDDDFPRILIKGSMEGIARIRLNDVEKDKISITAPPQEVCYTVAELEDATDPPRQSLKMEVLAMNGKVKVVGNVWRLLANKSYVRVPGSDVRLQKRSVSSMDSEQDGQTDNFWEWAVMLKKRGADGNLVSASSIDLRVGCILDGAVLSYRDGTKINLGPVWDQRGNDHTFGGHASKKLALPEGCEIAKVEINAGGRGWNCLSGIRMHLSNHGGSAGELNSRGKEKVETLGPDAGNRIVGFYGKSQIGSGFCLEFGIITAPNDFELSQNVYEMVELQNTDGGTGPRPGNARSEETENFGGNEEEEEFEED
jgi:hypothetical protein